MNRTCKHCGKTQTPAEVGTWAHVTHYSEDYKTKTKYWLCGKHKKKRFA